MLCNTGCIMQFCARLYTPWNLWEPHTSFRRPPLCKNSAATPCLLTYGHATHPFCRHSDHTEKRPHRSIMHAPCRVSPKSAPSDGRILLSLLQCSMLGTGGKCAAAARPGVHGGSAGWAVASHVGVSTQSTIFRSTRTQAQNPVPCKTTTRPTSACPIAWVGARSSICSHADRLVRRSALGTA